MTIVQDIVYTIVHHSVNMEFFVCLTSISKSYVYF